MQPHDAIPEARQLRLFLQAGEEAARRGGAVLRELMGKAIVSEKGPGDLVTTADLQSQSVIREFLLTKFPDHGFLGEEGDSESVHVKLANQAYCWIVDPLDGTLNFVHCLRSFSVSVALCFAGRIIAGAVYDPTTDECFSAAIGCGAHLDGVSIAPSRCDHLRQALVVVSLPSFSKADSLEVRRLLNVIEKVASFRRLGSAALNLCFVACGRIDAYWATNLKIWDVAAGWIIAAEAGAFLADFAGEPTRLEDPRFCVTSNSQLFNELVRLLEVS